MPHRALVVRLFQVNSVRPMTPRISNEDRPTGGGICGVIEIIIPFQFNPTNIYLGFLCVSGALGPRKRENSRLLFGVLGSSLVSFRLQAWESDGPVREGAWLGNCHIKFPSKGWLGSFSFLPEALLSPALSRTGLVLLNPSVWLCPWTVASTGRSQAPPWHSAQVCPLYLDALFLLLSRMLTDGQS